MRRSLTGETKKGRKAKGLFITTLSQSYLNLIIRKYISITQNVFLPPACFGHVCMAVSRRPHVSQCIKMSVSNTRRYATMHDAMRNGIFWNLPARIAAELNYKT
jgi:hypothetical protein